MLLDKSKYKLDGLTEEEKEIASEVLHEINLNVLDKQESEIRGIALSRKYTRFLEEEGKEGMWAVFLKKGSRLYPGYARDFFGDIEFYGYYTDEDLEETLKDIEGVIIYG